MRNHPSASRNIQLVTSSVLATGVMALSALLLCPAPARAEAECGVGAVVTCTPAGNPYANGISYTTSTGDQTINLQNGVVINTGGSLNPGVLAVQGDPTSSVVINGPAGVSITTSDAGAFGALLATNAGTITSNISQITTTGDNAEGILATSADGAINLTLGSVQTSGAGATGVDVNTNTGAAAVTINGAGVTSAQATAVSVVGQTVQVTTNAGSVITGATDGILVQSTGAATLNLAGTVGSTAGFAVDASGGPASVTNSGVVNGAVQLLGAGGNTFSNPGTFNASANSNFAVGPGGAIGADVFNNSGTLNILQGTMTAGAVTFTNLGTFNNTGLINLSNGHAGDILTLPGNFNGGTGSVLALDVNLTAAGAQTGCAATPLADCLRLTGGAATGTTGIRITNVGGAQTTSLGTGIVLVDATGGSIAPGAFVLDPGSRGYQLRGGGAVVAEGFFFDRLVPIGTTQVALVSTPDNTAFEFVGLGSAATDVWYATTGTWFNRESDLRETLTGPSDTALGHPGVWLKVVGDWTRRRQSQSVSSVGTTFTFDTSYNQNTTGIFGGVDFVSGAAKDRAWVLGVDGGYVQSDIRFRASPTFARLTGGVVGAYGTWIGGPWYVDGTVSANFLTLRDTIPQLFDGVNGASDRVSGHVRSVGGELETGWKAPLGAMAWVEPFASVAYVNTHFDSLAAPAGTVNLADVDSFRGSLGLRVSTTMTMADFKVVPTLYARVWDEWKGDESSAVLAAGGAILANDRFRGVFGDVGGQIALFSHGGVSAFVDGGYKFKSNYKDYTATIGVRYQF